MPHEATVTLIKFVGLLGVATIVPMFHQQLLTGPIVNATLFLAVAMIGVRGALFVGLIPSVIALSTGLLPAVLAPMIPFIMISNAILVIVFGYLWQRNVWGGIIAASVVKFAFLYATSSVVISLLLKSEVAGAVATMMSWPQLWTALVGGLIAVAVMRGWDMFKSRG